MPPLRVAVVVNARLSGRVLLAALAQLRTRARVVAELDTRGEAADLARLGALLRDHEPDVLVAAGGDGTAGLALQALLEAGAAERSALAFLPLGTGNNAARSFGLRALRGDPAALERALAAIHEGPRRPIDVGVLGARPFLGSVAFGMDADVLALRNRLERRLAPLGLGSGYGLYLGGVAASLLRGHGAKARLTLDGELETGPVYNLVVVNAPVYAGPLRFDGENDCSDGLLDVHAVASEWAYLAEYPKAWLRYLRVRRGTKAAPSPRLRRAREIEAEFEAPVPAQADGEEIPAATAFRIGVLPRALRVCVPG
jgi:diacylglycerol kinase family enzyme